MVVARSADVLVTNVYELMKEYEAGELLLAYDQSSLSSRPLPGNSNEAEDNDADDNNK